MLGNTNGKVNGIFAGLLVTWIPARESCMSPGIRLSFASFRPWLSSARQQLPSRFPGHDRRGRLMMLHRPVPFLLGTTVMLMAMMASVAMFTGCGKGTPGSTPSSAPADPVASAPAAKSVPDTSSIGWEGVYSFEEAWETEGQDIKNIITYELDVTRRGDSLLAEFNADGYMTSIHAHCTTIPNGEHLVVLFKEAGEDNMLNQAGEGDTLFTLVRRGDRLLTFWGVMAPQAMELEDGTPYFKKDRTP